VLRCSLGEGTVSGFDTEKMAAFTGSCSNNVRVDKQQESYLRVHDVPGLSIDADDL
tara:strand:+ start:23075 stop:23242 length:168 start_codon:yes stop_codon:yes gene_type:complete